MYRDKEWKEEKESCYEELGINQKPDLAVGKITEQFDRSEL